MLKDKREKILHPLILACGNFILIRFRVLIRMIVSELIRQPGLSLAFNSEVGNKG